MAEVVPARAGRPPRSNEGQTRQTKTGAARRKRDTDVQMGGVSSFEEGNEWGGPELNASIQEQSKEGKESERNITFLVFFVGSLKASMAMVKDLMQSYGKA